MIFRVKVRLIACAAAVATLAGVSPFAVRVLAQDKAPQAGAPGNEVYRAFNAFCIKHYGAEKEPLVYEQFGQNLKFLKEGAWQHVSEESACIGFETNLPAKAHVEYGEGRGYGQKTPVHERHFYVHLHYLRGLKPGAEYHYRIVATDERGNRIRTEDATFKTAKVQDTIHIPDDLQGPPYVLSKAGATYVLTKDIAADRTAIKVEAPDITLDLGGHTVVYNEEVVSEEEIKKAEGRGYWKYINASAFGLRGWKAKSARILNGTIRQGAGNGGSDAIGIGFAPVYLNGCPNWEIAGLTLQYTGVQVRGIHPHWSSGTHVHHNIITDCGDKLINRHYGCDAVAASERAHHNLVKRARHRGVWADQAYHNEIYVQSIATNAHGSWCNDGGKYTMNRTFGTGQHFCAYMVGAGKGKQSDIEFRDNLLHMVSEEKGSLNGFRLTQYGQGTKPMENIVYHNNLIIGKAYGGGLIRGVQFFSDPYVKDLVFRDNTIKVTVGERAAASASCVVTQGSGYGRAPKHLPIVYSNNTFISNIRNIHFGDGYGIGCNHHFIDCRFVRLGANEDYHTFSWRQTHGPSYNHVVRDCTFEGGAGLDKVRWGYAKWQQDFTVEWTLSVRTATGAKITVKDGTGTEVFSGKADQKGGASVALPQYKASTKSRTDYNPYTVIVEKNGRTATKSITVDKKQEVEIRP